MDMNYYEESGEFGAAAPFSLEAEQSVLGAILLEPSCLAVVMEILPGADYFYAVNNRLIYDAMMEMFTLGKPVDFVTILEKLKSSDRFDEGSGKVYLMQLANLVPSISNVDVYANIVRDKYDIRTLMQTARGILDDATTSGEDSAILLDSAEQRIFDIRQGKNMKGLQPIREIILETFDRLDRLNSPDSKDFKALPTGISQLDSVITGLNRTDLVVLAARPGIGKTSFALNIASHVGKKAKKRVAFFSLEMGKEQLASRVLSMEAYVEGTRLRTGNLSDEEWNRLIEAGDILSKTELYFDDTPGITVPEMKAKVRRLKDVDLIIIDYLQLMNSARKIDNRVQEVSEITRSLKIMAKELNLPVVALSQLARTSERRQTKEPMLSDLRDSGSIEQDADIVIFLSRDTISSPDAQVPDEEKDANSCDCIVAKNRHGDTRKIELHWQGEFMRFTAMEASRYA
jgi:replicative DNA helicase